MRTYARNSKATQPSKSAQSTKPNRVLSGQSRDVHPILHLQRTIGNQAIQRLLHSSQEGIAEKLPSSDSPRFSHDLSHIPVRTGRPQIGRGEEKADRSLTPFAYPVSDGFLEKPQEPFGDFNEETAEPAAVPPASGFDDTASMNDGGTTTGTSGSQLAQPVQAAAPVTRTVIRGPREMWNFNGESPPNYLVSARLSTNRRGGAFQWSVSPQLTLSSATAATLTVTTVAPSVPPGRDAWIRVRHTDAGGATTAASYRLTILAPDSLTHLRNVDSAHASFGYLSEIHYSIHDQFGTVLPRNVPLNEQWTGPSVIDFPSGNWTRSPQCGTSGVCSGSFNPADWHDLIGGEVDAGAIPAPVGPGHADAGVAADHWPGNWRIGSSTPGNGTMVSSVTWQRNRGSARHT